jgi:eukaryotic-like serine/threonine-protein kinase
VNTSTARGTSDVSRMLRTHGVLAVAGFLAAWVFVAFVMFPGTGAARVVTVPAVVGLPFEDAARRLADSGLQASLGESRLSGEAPKSTVLSQNPTAGSRVQRGERISLDVSAGQVRATIPVLAGKTRDEAEAALRTAGLQVGQITEEQSDHARGIVLSSQPRAGQVVPSGTGVDLVLSSGPGELTLPDVVGRELEDARSILEQLGLKVADVRYDSTSTVRPGQVLDQTPAAGTQVASGATITLRVSGKP